MKSYTSLILVLDDSLKIHDKEFFESCLQLGKKNYFVIQTTQSEDIPLPVLFIGTNSFFVNEKHSKEIDFFIEYKHDNLNFFSEPINHKQFFEVSTYDEVAGLWPLIVETISSWLSNFEQQMILAAQKNIQTLLKKSDKTSQPNNWEQLEKKLLSLSNREDIVGQVNDIIQKASKYDLSLVSIVDLIKKRNDFFFPLPYKKGQCLFLTSSTALKDAYIYRFLYHFFSRYMDWLEYEEQLEESNLLKNLIPEPILIMAQDGEGATYNTAFTKLSYSLNQCLELSNGDQVEIQDITYKIVIQENDFGEMVYFFFPIDEYISLGNQPTTQELGIISSSLAHELNNPLGGILAAINVLELDVEDEETMTQLVEMKAGVLRCKNLVEMFLGFSRPDSQNQFDKKLKTKEIIQQSFDLIRFRLIESNIKYCFEYVSKKEFKIKGNPHVLSMTFYLVWSELLTVYSRRNLVGGQNMEQLNLVIEENENEIKIKFLNEVKIESTFTKSKLFIHLCDLAKINSASNMGSISFISAQ